ncbi:MAG: hypothetical protein ABEK17_04695 [Candidatus Aenigmatarchaeota archaeon]
MMFVFKTIKEFKGRKGSMVFDSLAKVILMVILVAVLIVIVMGVQAEGQTAMKELFNVKEWLGFAGN